MDFVDTGCVIVVGCSLLYIISDCIIIGMNKQKITICTIGGASQDVFISGAEISSKCNLKTKECVESFPQGAKLSVDNIFFDTGGGATNAAVTFARQKMSTTYIGKLGHDPAGEAIVKVLSTEGVSTENVMYHPKLGSQYSTILLSESGERTIFIYRGAANSHTVDDYKSVDFSQFDWLYISSLAGAMDALETIVKRAHEAGVKIAINPGDGELKDAQRLIKLLEYVTLLSVNKDEAKMIVVGETVQDLAVELSKKVKYVLVSDGPSGSVATDGQKLVTAGMYEDVPVVDRTGAGDAFTSGFIVKIAEGAGIETAITFGSANSTSVVGAIGSKTNILDQSATVHAMSLETSII